MSDGLRQVMALSDPIGGITDLAYRPSGIQVGRMRVPLGVIGIIYEARPNVTADAAGLCLKVRQRRHPARRFRGAACQSGDRRLREEGAGIRPACPPMRCRSSPSPIVPPSASCCD